MNDKQTKNQRKNPKRESAYMSFQSEWKERYEAGESYTCIGKRYGVTYTTVQRVLKDVVETRPKKKYAHLMEEWKRLYEEEKWNIVEIGAKYKVNPATVSKYFKKEGVIMRRATGKTSPFQQYEEEWVRLYEKGETLQSIGKRYGVHAQTVHNHISQLTAMRSYSVTSRQYNIEDETFLDVIDTPEKAYWLGVWFGAGFISKRIAGFECTLIVEKEKESLLEAFRTRVGYEKQVEKEGDKKSRLQFSDKHLFETLQSQGLGVYKTRNIRFPSNVPPSLYPSLLLGLFDTKGAFESTHKKESDEKVTVTFAVHHDFAIQLKKCLEKELSLTCTLVPRNHHVTDRRDGVYLVQLEKKEEVLRLVKWMYQSADTHYCLPRMGIV